MTVISVPEPGRFDKLGDLPPGVRVVEWDGRGDPPAGAEEIELFVGPYDPPPPSAETLAALPKLRVVQLLSAGVDAWLPVVPPGVQLCNARGVHGATTAELAVAGMLAALRRIPEFVAAQERGRWDRLDGDSLADRRVLVIGAGDVGRRIGEVAAVLDARVAYVSRTSHGADGTRPASEGFDALPRLLPDQDVVVLAVPLTEATTGMVDADFLASLPDGALLVNVARGPVVVTDALLAELDAGRLRAYLDVTDPEPLPPDHPLWRAPNVLLTPHVGGGTRGWARRAYRLVGDQVHAYVAGETLANQVGEAY